MMVDLKYAVAGYSQPNVNEVTQPPIQRRPGYC